MLTHPAPIKQFIRDWRQSDRGNLTVSLAQFAGNPAYGSDALLGDFARFRFLLGMTAGEGVLPAHCIDGPPASTPFTCGNCHAVHDYPDL